MGRRTGPTRARNDDRLELVMATTEDKRRHPSHLSPAFKEALDARVATMHTDAPIPQWLLIEHIFDSLLVATESPEVAGITAKARRLYHLRVQAAGDTDPAVLWQV